MRFGVTTAADIADRPNQRVSQSCTAVSQVRRLDVGLDAAAYPSVSRGVTNHVRGTLGAAAATGLAGCSELVQRLGPRRGRRRRLETQPGDIGATVGGTAGAPQCTVPRWTSGLYRGVSPETWRNDMMDEARTSAMLIKKPADIRESEVTPEGAVSAPPRVHPGRRQRCRRGGDGGRRLDAQRARSEAAQNPNAYKFPNLKKGSVRHDGEAELVQGHHHLQQLLRVRARQGRSGALRPHPQAAPVVGRRRGAVRQAGHLQHRRHRQAGSRSRSASTACAASRRGRWSFPWVGFPLADLVKRFEPTAKAKYVEFKTLVDMRQMPGQTEPRLQWPYIEGLRMDEAMHPLTLMAVGLYGEVLPNQNGAPIRLVVPWKYGFKGIKSIVRMRFVENAAAQHLAAARARASTASTPTSIRTSITRAGARRPSAASASCSGARRCRSTATPIRSRRSTPAWICGSSTERRRTELRTRPTDSSFLVLRRLQPTCTQ